MDELRRRWIAYWRHCRECWKDLDDPGPPMSFALLDLKCGARTRSGHACKQRALFDNGRCKWHGGCSTGPKTAQGKDQARINGRKGGRPTKPKS